MSGLQDLLERMREHPAFNELLAAIEAPTPRLYKPGENADTQAADWIFRSGRQMQNQIWREYLTKGIPRSGEDSTSRQEKS